MNKTILSVLIKFAVSLIIFALAIVRIVMGYVPSGKIVKYGNITATDQPVSFWITIGFMFIVSFVFFVWGIISAVKYRNSAEK